MNSTTDFGNARSERAAFLIELSLRDEEGKVLAEVGRLRVVRTSDLAETVYGNRHPH